MFMSNKQPQTVQEVQYRHFYRKCGELGRPVSYEYGWFALLRDVCHYFCLGGCCVLAGVSLHVSVAGVGLERMKEGREGPSVAQCPKPPRCLAVCVVFMALVLECTDEGMSDFISPTSSW